MAHHLIIGFNDQIGPWVHARIPWLPAYQPDEPGKLRAVHYVGVATGPEATDDLLAAWFYFNFVAPQDKPIDLFKGRKWGGTCEFGLVVKSPAWATRRNIRALFSIPFEQYNCRKVLATVPSTHKRSIRLAEGFGMVREGQQRHHFASGVHALTFGLMRAEFDKTWGNPSWKRKRCPNQAPSIARHLQQPIQHAAAAV